MYLIENSFFLIMAATILVYDCCFTFTFFKQRTELELEFMPLCKKLLWGQQK